MSSISSSLPLSVSHSFISLDVKHCSDRFLVHCLRWSWAALRSHSWLYRTMLMCMHAHTHTHTQTASDAAQWQTQYPLTTCEITMPTVTDVMKGSMYVWRLHEPLWLELPLLDTNTLQISERKQPFTDSGCTGRVKPQGGRAVLWHHVSFHTSDSLRITLNRANLSVTRVLSWNHALAQRLTDGGINGNFRWQWTLKQFCSHSDTPHQAFDD